MVHSLFMTGREYAATHAAESLRLSVLHNHHGNGGHDITTLVADWSIVLSDLQY